MTGVTRVVTITTTLISITWIMQTPRGRREVFRESTMRKSNKLTARQVAAAKPGRHGDGAGLYLVVAPSGARKWIMRFTWAGKPNEMGLGGAAVSLADARDKAAEARKLVAAGINPITAPGKPVTKHPEGKRSANARTSFLMPRLPNGATKSTGRNGR